VIRSNRLHFPTAISDPPRSVDPDWFEGVVAVERMELSRMSRLSEVKGMTDLIS
jgi:hypothetical protein